MDTETAAELARLRRDVDAARGQVSFLERNAEGGARPMRLSFATKADLDAFTGWSGLVGFVEATNIEYIWISGAWKLWSCEYVTFTPSWSVGFTLGNGTVNHARYSVVAGGLVTVEVRATLGTTSAITSQFGILLPVGGVNSGTVGTASAARVGHGTYYDASAGVAQDLAVVLNDDSSMRLRALDASGTYAKQANVNATVPVAFASSDRIWFQFAYQSQGWISA